MVDPEKWKNRSSGGSLLVVLADLFDHERSAEESAGNFTEQDLDGIRGAGFRFEPRTDREASDRTVPVAGGGVLVELDGDFHR